MDQRCRWGIIGTDKIARVVAGALANSATGPLVAVAIGMPYPDDEDEQRKGAPVAVENLILAGVA